MQKANEVLELLTAHHALTEQLRQGDLRAFDKLSLSFDELYALGPQKDEPDFDSTGCCGTCILTDGISELA